MDRRGVEQGEEDQGDDRTHRQSAHDTDCHRAIHRITQQRYHTDNSGQRGHQDGTYTRDGCLHHGHIRCFVLLLLQTTYLVHQDNGVLHHHTDQAHHTDNGHEGKGLAET